MNSCFDILESLVKSLTIHSMTSYSWMGKKQSLKLPYNHKIIPSPRSIRKVLLFNLNARIYENFYCCGGPTPISYRTVSPSNYGDSNSLNKDLSLFNLGNGCLEPGWSVISLKNNTALVKRRGLLLKVKLEDCFDMSNKNHGISIGSNVSIRYPKEMFGLSPGYYTALGNKYMGIDKETIVRVYWNISSEGAIPLIKNITFMLNHLDIPFSFKILNNPYGFNARCDTAVLYIRKDDYRLVFGVIIDVYSRVYPFLNDETPVFTKKIARGLSIAEDPPTKESFGQARCRILAEAMLFAFEERKKTIGERIQAIIARFTEEGLDMSKPFLNHDSLDIYDIKFPMHTDPTNLSSKGLDDTSAFTVTSQHLLDTASHLGGIIIKQAIWRGDRCNWVGFNPDSSFGALGPEIYAGTSGISIFLARLFTATDHQQFRKTAIGAITQALSAIDNISNKDKIGLYSGYIGIILAAARLGKILDESLLDKASKLIDGFSFSRNEIVRADIIAGKAGTIVSLLALRNIMDGKSGYLLDLACILGEKLIVTADSKNGYSWSSPDIRTHHNLYGFAHGTSGIAFSLLKLFEATGDLKFNQAAELAFKYERYNFEHLKISPEIGNFYLDKHSTFNTRWSNLSWCLGLSGIVISRLVAYQITGKKLFRDESVEILKLITDPLKSISDLRIVDFSLCHGLTGTCDAVLYAKQALGKEVSESVIDTNSILNLAFLAIKKFRNTDRQWPCGIQGGQSPGLLTGLAGIGYFYLRLIDPQKIPSILVPG